MGVTNADVVDRPATAKISVAATTQDGVKRMFVDGYVVVMLK